MTHGEHAIPTAADRLADADAPQRYQHTRWNFAVIVADASAFITGLAFASPLVVLPLFMERLTGSTVLVGVLSALQLAGWFLPQLPTASLVENRPHKKPLLLKACLVGRVPMGLIPLALLVFFDHPWLVLALVLGLYLLFYISDGVTGVPWTDITAKTIPPRLRGRFFGAMQLIGGALSVAAGLLVRKILGHRGLPYPRDYAVLFAIQFFLLMVSLLFLVLIREPLRPVREHRRSPLQLIRAAPAMLRAKPQLLHLIAVAAFTQLGIMAMPFYVVYARLSLGVPEEMAGIFVSAQMAGVIASSMVWALLSDRRGSRRVIQGTAICALAVPLFALFAPMALRDLGPATVAYSYALTFFLTGAIGNGVWIGFTNFVLEVVGDEERASYLGLLNAMSAPAIALPIIGGWLVGATSYHAVFAIAAASGAIGVVVAAWLPEPREMKPPGPA